MARKENGYTVSKDIAKKVAAVYAEFGATGTAQKIIDAFDRYGSSHTTIYLDGLPMAALEKLETICSGYKELEQRLKANIKILKNPEAQFGRLDNLPEAFYRWMTIKSIDGWLYELTSDGEYVPWAVDYAEYIPAEGSGDNYVPATGVIHLVANAANRGSYRSYRGVECHTKTLIWRPTDVVGMTVPELLMQRGFHKEKPELRAAYDAEIAKFKRMSKLYNHQFVGKNVGGTASVDSGEDVEVQRPRKVILEKYVNEEELVNRTIVTQKGNDEWVKYGITGDEFTSIPLHPYLYLYNLRLYSTSWVHVNNVEEYVYDKTLGDKLVLPQAHRDLIDVLTQDMDVFAEDIIQGKSGGTPILCFGEPGLGKTLTAEVYAELVERPLYKVHSGQLGTTAHSVEENLKQYLERSERWGAVLLIDEADVYIAKRGGDLDKNAVVAAFLRTLEYFHGLLFMTTNRIDDVDDAIISRMIALVHYERPDKEMSAKLWRILGKQFDIDFATRQTDKLWDMFPGLPGRDIKNILRLVKKYCARKNLPVTYEAFRICAMFRGIDAKDIKKEVVNAAH